MNIDKHPLRYSSLVSKIEDILLHRFMSNRLNGYTLETAIEIAEMIPSSYHGESARLLTENESGSIPEAGANFVNESSLNQNEGLKK